jgi:uncharacterized membrane protein YhaH (DUF805 family)
MARLLEATHLLAPAHTLSQTCVTGSNGQPLCVETTSGGSFFAFAGVFLIIDLFIVAVSIAATVFIIRKAGYSGWWVLVSFVPIVNFVFLLIFAFSTWPVLVEVQRLRALSYGSGSPGRGAPGGPYLPPVVPMPGPAAGPTPPSPGGPPPPVAAEPGVEAEHEPVAQTGETMAIPSFGEVMRAGGVPPVDAPSTVGEPVGEPVTSGVSPAGWFPAPEGPPGRLRYWDGANWTDQYH